MNHKDAPANILLRIMRIAELLAQAEGTDVARFSEAYKFIHQKNHREQPLQEKDSPAKIVQSPQNDIR